MNCMQSFPAVCNVIASRGMPALQKFQLVRIQNGWQCPFEVVCMRLAADVLGPHLFALLALLLYPLALCMQAARNAEPPDMAKAIRKKEAARDAKRNKLEKAMKQDTAASKAGEAAPAGSIDDRKAKVQVASLALLLPPVDT